jgi:hypothetical protein
MASDPLPGDLPAGWHLYYLFGVTLASDFPFANQLLPGTAPPDLTFTCTRTAPLSPNWEQARLVTSSSERTAQGIPALAVYRLDECEVLRCADLMDFYLWPGRIVCHLRDPDYEFLVEIRFLGTVMVYWLALAGIRSLHAASVVVDGEAVSFLATNRGGKTSLAATFMQAGYPLLTDDRLCLQRSGERFEAQSGYPQMRMWPEQAEHFLGHSATLPVVHPAYEKRNARVGEGEFGRFYGRAAPLRAIYLPARREADAAETAIEIAPLAAPEALFALLQDEQFGGTASVQGWQKARLAWLSDVVTRVSIRRLRYPSGYEHLPRVREAILKDLAAPR